MLHVYCVEDGEITHVIAETEAEAFNILARDFDGDDATGEKYREENGSEITQLANDAIVGVKEECDGEGDEVAWKRVERTAAEWCAREGKGILCSSVFG